MIIAKEQGNFETLSHVPGDIFFLVPRYFVWEARRVLSRGPKNSSPSARNPGQRLLSTEKIDILVC
ncbi:MAG: hypothetical protein JEZ11_08080 [Desulfobacterales bacterium]|nr:hypothetical protein [Desulfobacterales bacterium]